MQDDTTHRDPPRPVNSRRSFFRVAALCTGLPIVGRAAQTPEERIGGKPLSEGDHVPLQEDPAALVQCAYELGCQYEGKYGGCAQCTVAALQDATDLIPVNEDIFLAASCLDGGATPTAKANCGAFTGAGIVIGHLCGRSRANFEGGANLAHRLIRQVHDGVVEAFGSVLCGEIRAATNRNCVEVVGTGARLAAKAILDEFGEYNPRGV